MKIRASSQAYDFAVSKVGSHRSFDGIVDQFGHNFQYYYQTGLLQIFSEEDIINGIMAGYKRPVCRSAHWEAFADHLSTDECRMFQHPEEDYPYGAGIDHLNMRWFNEWCEVNNPRILKKISSYFKMKAFW